MNDLPSSQKESPLGLADLLSLLFLSGILVLLCIASSHRHLFWSDELIGMSLLHNPTYRETMRGWWDGADGGPPLYYLLCRTWLLLFGFGELALRLFSTAGMAASMVVVWIMARRFFSIVPVASAVTLVYLYPVVMIWQSENGRFYGLYLTTAAFACFMYLRTADRDRITRLDLFLLALASFCLIASHTLGIVWCGVLLCAMIARDLFRSRLRWSLYGASLAGWIAFPLSLHAIRNAAAVAQNGFWTVKPSFLDLFWGAFLYNRGLPKLLLILAALAALVTIANRAIGRQSTGALRSGRALQPRVVSLLFLLAALYSAELVLFVKSHRGVSIFADRYLLPLSIALIFLLAWPLQVMLNAIAERSRNVARLGFVPLLLLVAICARHAFHMRYYDVLYPNPDFVAHLEAKLPPNEAVATTFLPYFIFLKAYDHQHHPIFLEDWTYDLDPRNGHPDLSGQHMMENFKLSGYGEVTPCSDIVAQHQDFTLIAEDARKEWVEKRLAHDPALQLTRLADNEEWYPATIWRIHRLVPPDHAVCR